MLISGIAYIALAVRCFDSSSQVLAFHINSANKIPRDEKTMGSFITQRLDS